MKKLLLGIILSTFATVSLAEEWSPREGGIYDEKSVKKIPRNVVADLEDLRTMFKKPPTANKYKRAVRRVVTIDNAFLSRDIRSETNPDRAEKRLQKKLNKRLPKVGKPEMTVMGVDRHNSKLYTNNIPHDVFMNLAHEHCFKDGKNNC